MSKICLSDEKILSKHTHIKKKQKTFIYENNKYDEKNKNKHSFNFLNFLTSVSKQNSFFRPLRQTYLCSVWRDKNKYVCMYVCMYLFIMSQMYFDNCLQIVQTITIFKRVLNDIRKLIKIGRVIYGKSVLTHKSSQKSKC